MTADFQQFLSDLLIYPEHYQQFSNTTVQCICSSTITSNLVHRFLIPLYSAHVRLLTLTQLPNFNLSDSDGTMKHSAYKQCIMRYHTFHRNQKYRFTEKMVTFFPYHPTLVTLKRTAAPYNVITDACSSGMFSIIINFELWILHRLPGRGISPVARPLPTQRTTQTQKNRGRPSMPRVGQSHVVLRMYCLAFVNVIYA
jgi:hypothetical protein